MVATNRLSSVLEVCNHLLASQSSVQMPRAPFELWQLNMVLGHVLDSTCWEIKPCSLSLQLEYANERYKLLESHHAAQKRELEVTREKSTQLSTALSKHQLSQSSITQELLATRERLAKAEVSGQMLKNERDMLAENERRARTQYESLLREQKGQSSLLTNLQAIQNNLERSEFETKTRLRAQIEALEREVALFKEKVRSEEEKQSKTSEAYETQVKDLGERLERSKEACSQAEAGLRDSEERVKTLSEELGETQRELGETKTNLEEARDKVRTCSLFCS